MITATTLEFLKTYLGISEQDTAKDTLLLMLLESCTDAAEAYLGRPIVARALTGEAHDFEGIKTKYLQLQHYPVMEITKITQDGVALDISTLKADKHNGLIKKGIPWRGIVAADYKAGLAACISEVPKNIQLAIWLWVADILQLQEAGPIKSESLGDYSISYLDDHKMPSSVSLLLEAYRRISL